MSKQNVKFISSKQCLEFLSGIELKLKSENSFGVRVAFDKGDLIRKELFPILKVVKDREIIECVIRILKELTTPIELSSWVVSSIPEEARQLEAMVQCAKVSLLEDAMTGVVHFIQDSFAAIKEDRPMAEIRDSLLLIRNLVHSSPQQESFAGYRIPKIKFIRSLFAFGLDSILLQILNNRPQAFCALTVSEIITSLYKYQEMVKDDPHFSEMSGSSQDDESDDSGQASSSSSSPLPSSSVSSDNSHKSSSPRDSGYAQQSSRSSSSDDQSDEAMDTTVGFALQHCSEHWHHGKRTTQCPDEIESDDSSEEDERCHPPVGKRRQSHPIVISKQTKCKRVRSLSRSKQTDIPPVKTNIRKDSLKAFTQKFLNNGFEQLVTQLKRALLSSSEILERCRALCVLTSLIQVSSVIPLSVRHLTYFLSDDVIGFMTSESERIFLELQKSAISYSPTLLQYIHLLVKAIGEILTAVDHVMPATANNPLDSAFVKSFNEELVEKHRWHQLLLNLIANHRHPCFDKSYLVDLIVTNHKAVVLLDHLGIDIRTHLQQLATFQVMELYGEILQDYKTNSNLVNNSILTIMHHVAGDLESADVLLQPKILKTFCAMMEDDQDLEIIQWEELIHYILHKFSQNARRKRPIESSNGSAMESQQTNLYWWYLQFENDWDPIGKIAEHLDQDLGWSRQQVIEQLYLQCIVTKDQCYKLMETEDRMMTTVKNGGKDPKMADLGQELSMIELNDGTVRNGATTYFEDLRNLGDASMENPSVSPRTEDVLQPCQQSICE